MEQECYKIIYGVFEGDVLHIAFIEKEKAYKYAKDEIGLKILEINVLKSILNSLESWWIF